MAEILIDSRPVWRDATSDPSLTGAAFTLSVIFHAVVVLALVFGFTSQDPVSIPVGGLVSVELIGGTQSWGNVQGAASAGRSSLAPPKGTRSGADKSPTDAAERKKNLEKTAPAAENSLPVPMVFEAENGAQPKITTPDRAISQAAPNDLALEKLETPPPAPRRKPQSRTKDEVTLKPQQALPERRTQSSDAALVAARDNPLDERALNGAGAPDKSPLGSEEGNAGATQPGGVRESGKAGGSALGASAPDSGPGFQLGSVGNPLPDYPWSARRRGQEGRVVLRVHVDAKGSVTSVRVLASSGYRSLDKVASEVVERWIFEPAVRAGVKVAGRVDVPFVFKLTGDGRG